jgi:hypothetical protein
MQEETAAEAARLIRAVLAAVERGELEANSSQARILLRQLEGAATALELASGSATDSEVLNTKG